MSCERCARRTVAPRSRRPAGRLQLAREQPHERGLARPVDPDQRDAIAGSQTPGQLAQDRAIAERQTDVDGVEDLVAQARGREAQQLRAVARLGLVGDQRVGGLDAELRLRRPRRRAASQPRELLAQQLLAAALASGLLAVALGAREDVGRVAPVVLVDRAVGELPRRGADRVQEPAVVRHDQHRAAPRREVAREPVDAFDVELVRRLVQQQQLGRIEQQARERDPPTLASGEAGDRRLDALREELQPDAAHEPVEHAAKARVAGPLVIGARADERLADRLRLVELVALAQQRDVDVSRPRQRARVGLLDACDQAQQRRLAVAVAPHDSDALARRDPQRHVAQHRAAAVALRDGLQVEDVARARHPPCILADRRPRFTRHRSPRRGARTSHRAARSRFVASVRSTLVLRCIF